MARTLRFVAVEWKRLQEISEKAYPREACGLLFGQEKDGVVHVKKVQVLSNLLEGQNSARLQELAARGAVALPKERMERGGAFEFLIDPNEQFAKILEAEKQGLDQVGLFHSHPDHPAKPSPTDQAQPYLAGWSNIIVAVDGGKFKEARSWFRISEESPFQEETIIVE